jgi:biotin operon repressor
MVAPRKPSVVILLPKQLRAEWVDVMALDARLSNNAFRVACVIGSYFNKYRGDAYPSIETLAKVMGASERTVWAGAKELEDRGYLVVKRRELGTIVRKCKNGTESEVRLAGGKGVANTYQPAFERSQISATTTGSKLAERCDLYWVQRSQISASMVATDCDPTLTSSSSKKKNPTGPCAHALGPAGDELRRRLGSDVFESWFGKVTIYAETHDLIRLAAPTRFTASRIRQDFENQALEAWQSVRPTIQRIEIVLLGKEAAA